MNSTGIVIYILFPFFTCNIKLWHKYLGEDRDKSDKLKDSPVLGYIRKFENEFTLSILLRFNGYCSFLT